MTHTITIYRESDTFDPMAILSNLETVGEGTLTTDHAASSYGQPVLVYEGTAYGPGDVIARGWDTGCGVCHWGESEPTVNAMCEQWRRMLTEARQAVAK